MNVVLDIDRKPLLIRRELMATGYSPAEVERARASGEIRSVHRGVYSPAEYFDRQDLRGQHVLRARAAAHAAPSVVVSHISAAALHGLPVDSAVLGRIHLTRPGRTGARGDSRRILHVAPLDPADVIEIDGVRATSLARTLVDVARTETFGVAVPVADAALHQAPTIADQVARALGDVRGCVGASVARRALQFADGRAESVGESRLRVACRALDLPEPDLQCRVYGRRGEFIGRTDLGFLGSGLLLEFDGKVKYRDPAMTDGRDVVDVVVEEALREKRLRELGWQVVRIVWSDLFDLPGLGRRIRALLARAEKVLATVGIDGSVRALDPIQIPR
ncbi:Transcriptional regulator, AbiEi antitoxin, Type IV TA system [Nakamurella panacisegetis]|uniref:Transcriptional regulator, AbiEi antitoxin, Type IV TA system n=1 Tax=Nakamurella panacisegetis TaxID=1090615 RepID=A0A1H0NZN8_9ACTN|nr:type IV toxin-antitoxin system AbiEi family antitoxin domain-containing protein [Nakamurella panacisegetis]SDO97905.1 Transcriptional regulator, AbiEi antitoxin, Type IV TA system [Nakamurella panacisegetis]